MAKFNLVAGHVALDFVNTLDNRYDPQLTVDLLPDYPAFLEFCAQSGLIGEADTIIQHGGEPLARAVELREALFGIFTAVVCKQPPPDRDVAAFNRFLRGAGCARRLTWEGGRFAIGIPQGGGEPDWPIWRIAESAAELLVSSALGQIRECDSETCRWLFWDSSKNHSRRWCDMKVCGNRVKARRFQSKRKS